LPEKEFYPTTLNSTYFTKTQTLLRIAGRVCMCGLRFLLFRPAFSAVWSLLPDKTVCNGFGSDDFKKIRYF